MLRKGRDCWVGVWRKGFRGRWSAFFFFCMIPRALWRVFFSPRGGVLHKLSLGLGLFSWWKEGVFAPGMLNN